MVLFTTIGGCVFVVSNGAKEGEKNEPPPSSDDDGVAMYTLPPVHVSSHTWLVSRAGYL
jgi:hypothetical protein